MSGQPAARVGDLHTCPMSTGPVPHVGGPIMPVGEPTVLIGGQPSARLGDMAMCVAPAPDSIVKGAFPVPVGKKPASRLTDQTAHGGVIVGGLPTVLIGLAGTTGNPRVGTMVCNAAASGRAGNSPTQAYQNCGVESSRQIINHNQGTNLTENGLLTTAVNNGWASGTPGAPFNPATTGFTGAGTRQSILASNGVPSTIQATNPTNIGVATAQGQGVIVNLDAGVLAAPAATPPGALHAVVVTGVEYDDAGNRVAVIINDTGTGQCGQRVNPATFDAATAAHPNSQLNVTTNPIW